MVAFNGPPKFSSASYSLIRESLYQYFKGKPIHFYKNTKKSNFEVQSSTIAAIRRKSARIIFNNIWFWFFNFIYFSHTLLIRFFRIVFKLIIVQAWLILTIKNLIVSSYLITCPYHFNVNPGWFKYNQHSFTQGQVSFKSSCPKPIFTCLNIFLTL